MKLPKNPYEPMSIIDPDPAYEREDIAYHAFNEGQQSLINADWLPPEQVEARTILDHTRILGALNLITQYGGIDGDHHKQWLLDQIVHTLADNYADWVRDYQDGEDGPGTYIWETGIAP